MIAFLLLLAMQGIIIAGQNNVITYMEVIVSEEGTSVSLNVPANFNYEGIARGKTVEIVLLDCNVSILGLERTEISCYMPLFEKVILRNDEITDNARLVLELKDGVKSVSMTQTLDHDSITFDFRESSGIQINAEIKPVPVRIPKAVSEEIEVSLPTHTVDEKSDVIQKASHITEIAQFEIYPVGDPVDLLPKIENEKSFAIVKSDVLPDYPLPLPLYPSPQTIEASIEKNESENKNEKFSTEPEKSKRAKVISIHYSQGRIDRDVISFDFDEFSPNYNFESDSQGRIVMVFHNVLTPYSILPENEVKREVQGTFLKTIYLRRFYEMDKEALQVVITGREPLKIDIDDLGGIIDIVIRRKGV